MEQTRFRGRPLVALASWFGIAAAALAAPAASAFNVYTVDGAPQFVDAANGDYHQALTSPGVDFAPANDGVDLDGNPRTLDLTDVVNQWGPLDVGAYEIQAGKIIGCSVADTIFCDGFDGEL